MTGHLIAPVELLLCTKEAGTFVPGPASTSPSHYFVLRQKCEGGWGSFVRSYRELERRASPTAGAEYRSWRSQQAHGAPLETAAEFWELSGGPAQRLAQIVHNRPLPSGGSRRQQHPLRHLRDAQRRHIDEAADVVDLAELRDNEELAADL